MESAQSFSRIKKSNSDFENPTVKIKLGGNELTTEKKVVVSSVEIEITSGFEASSAEFTATMLNELGQGEFSNDLLDKYFALGVKAEAMLGYDGKEKPVFTGYISSVSYNFLGDEPLSVTVECLDAKGLMMSNKSFIQRSEDSYDKCVKSIANNYKLCIDKMTVESTDKLEYKIEITGESDYSFIVSTAKKLGFNFFICKGEMFFRPADSKAKLALILDENSAAEFFEVRYTLTGLAKCVEVRATDDGEAKEITGTAQTNAKFSRGGGASKALNGAKRVFINETVASQQEAEKLAKIKLEDINRKFGLLKWKTNGLPEVFPDDEVKLEFGAKDLSKDFRIRKVRHTMKDEQFFTYIEGELRSL